MQQSCYCENNLGNNFFHNVIKTGIPDRVTTPLDFFNWGYVKVYVYKNKPQIIEELKDKIYRFIGELDQGMCQQVISNFVARTEVCQQSRGGHMTNIIFHT